MSEYVYKRVEDATPAWRCVYVIWCDGREVGALLSREAADVLADSLERAGNCDVSICEWLQPIDRAGWLDDSLGLVPAHDIVKLEPIC